MKYASQYLSTAALFIKDYDGTIPLHHYLKQKFAADKKFGSRDRKTISALCYYYFRLGRGEIVLTIEERILLGAFLCDDQSHLLEPLKPEWYGKLGLPLQDKLKEINSFYAAGIFPLQNRLSDGIEGAAFSLSFLIQPSLFIRIRPGKEDIVIQKLTAASIAFTQLTNNCLALENGTKLEEVMMANKEYVVQDYNSQKTGEFLSTVISGPSTTVWDCCAASGGKSVLAYDINPDINLTVSDIRPSVLSNLYKRFNVAEIMNYRSFIANVSNSQNLRAALGSQQFNVIICDAPCTGSGTWGRTPEQLHFFDEKEIDRYSKLQKEIIKNASLYLKPGGHLLYITCSVFKKENEGVVAYVKENLQLKLRKMELLKGYSLKADTMFAALFQMEK